MLQSVMGTNITHASENHVSSNQSPEYVYYGPAKSQGHGGPYMKVMYPKDKVQRVSHR